MDFKTYNEKYRPQYLRHFYSLSYLLHKEEEGLNNKFLQDVRSISYRCSFLKHQLSLANNRLDQIIYNAFPEMMKDIDPLAMAKACEEITEEEDLKKLEPQDFQVIYKKLELFPEFVLGTEKILASSNLLFLTKSYTMMLFDISSTFDTIYRDRKKALDAPPS